ncbi:MAG: DUF3108 domain-containing protein [Muribaculaceae bacterium]|nr:DUF3108 domain-containing protein [Muribaculaceae bacterium]
MKKVLLIALVAMIGVTASNAQYFSTVQGQQLNYKTNLLDNKDEAERATKSTMISVETAADGVITAREQDVQTDSSNPLLEVTTYRGYVYDPATDITKVIVMSAADFKEFVVSMISQGAAAAGQPVSEMALAELSNSLSSKGSLEFDLDPKAAPDTKLPKSNLRLSAGMDTMRANLWDGKFLGSETVTVPAGTFDCLKVSYTMVINGGEGVDKRFITDWYAKGVGLVKSVETDKKGNPTSEDVLISIK